MAASAASSSSSAGLQDNEQCEESDSSDSDGQSAPPPLIFTLGPQGLSAVSRGDFSCVVVGISAKMQVIFVLRFLRICGGCKLRISEH